jgi:hypothetical protein
MSKFIPITQFQSENITDLRHTLFVNMNSIAAFSHMKSNEESLNDCLLVKFHKTVAPEMIICKQTNPVAYKMLMKKHTLSK